MSLSAVGMGSAVVYNAKLSSCRRVVGIVIVQREQGRLALQLYNNLYARQTMNRHLDAGGGFA